MLERLKNIPFMLGFILFAMYIAYGYYQFTFSSDGETATHSARVNQSKKELTELQNKLGEGRKFIKTLDQKKEELRAQVKRLSDYQGVLSDRVDIPEVIKLLITEARRISLKVNRIEPGNKTPREFYQEQEFKLNVNGSFSQIVLLTQRISQLQRILKLEGFSLKPVKNSVGRMTGALEGDLSITAYHYNLSNEDTIARPFK